MKTKIWPLVVTVLVGAALASFLFWASFSRIEVEGPRTAAPMTLPSSRDCGVVQPEVKKEFGLVADSHPGYRLDAYCDAPHSNLVYVAASTSGISVAVVFDPERCAPQVGPPVDSVTLDESASRIEMSDSVLLKEK